METSYQIFETSLEKFGAIMATRRNRGFRMILSSKCGGLSLPPQQNSGRQWQPLRRESRIVGPSNAPMHCPIHKIAGRKFIMLGSIFGCAKTVFLANVVFACVTPAILVIFVVVKGFKPLLLWTECPLVIFAVFVKTRCVW